MKMAKKAFSIVLALVMLVNVFAVMGSAAAPDAALDLYLSSDKAVYAQGEEIILKVSVQAVPEVGDLRIGSGCAIAWDSTGIAQISTDVTSLTPHGFTALVDGYDESISCLVDKTMTTVTNENNWDDLFILGVADDGQTHFSATSKTDLYTFKLKVADDAPDGEYVIGFNKDSYVDYNAYQNDHAMGGVYGFDDDYGYGTTVNYAFHNVTIRVGKSASLTELGAQIRYDRNTDGSYANQFDVRTRATISDADFNSLFTSNDDAETKIVNVGFVYADVAKASFSAEDAQKVAKGTAVEGYTNAPVDYIQDCDGYYMFTCLVEDIPQADISNPLTTYAYMGIDTNADGEADQWIFYTDATSVSFQSLYDNNYAAAAAKYGW